MNNLTNGSPSVECRYLNIQYISLYKMEIITSSHGVVRRE